MGNLAYNTNPTASTYVMPYSPSRAVDGSLSPFSRWLCNTLPGWVQVDLQYPNTYSVNRWVIRHMPVAGWKTADYANSDFKLQGSNDKSTWFDIDTITGNTASITDRTYANPTSFRYYRVYFTKGLNTNSKLASIYEFELYQFFSSALSNLTISSGTLSPAFSSGTLAYTATVTTGTSSILVVPTAQSVSATIKVNGVTAHSGSPTSVNLAYGNNTIPVVVTDANGTITYTITVTRPASNYLSNLTAAQTNGTNIALSPIPFVKTTMGYTASVGFDVSTMTITPTAENSTSTITVNGTTVASGQASVPLSLNVGVNAIPVVVTNGGSSQIYTVTVTRADSSYLSNLTGLSGTTAIALTPSPFVKTIMGYSATVGYDVSSITVTPTAEGASASITVNGSSVTSGQPSASIPLGIGTTAIPVVVTAGGVTQNYSITITRIDTSLSNLVVKAPPATTALTTNPTFQSSILEYAVTATGKTSISFTPTASSTGSSITVGGTPVNSGSSTTKTMNVGANTILIVVTNGNVSTTYKVTVTR